MESRNSYDELSDPQRSDVLVIIGQLSCAITGHLEQKLSEVVGRETVFCQTCDFEEAKPGAGTEKDKAEFEELWTMFNSILPKLTRTPGPRIAAMVALRRILMHSPCLDQMQLSSSASGEFCLHAFRSSIRELRVATRFVWRLHTQIGLLLTGM